MNYAENTGLIKRQGTNIRNIKGTKLIIIEDLQRYEKRFVDPEEINLEKYARPLNISDSAKEILNLTDADIAKYNNVESSEVRKIFEVNVKTNVETKAELEEDIVGSEFSFELSKNPVNDSFAIDLKSLKRYLASVNWDSVT